MVNLRHKMVLALIIIMLGITGLSAGNSIFSLAGLPYQYSGNDIYSQGMGDVGIGDGLRLSNGFANPALMNTAGTVNFYTALKMGNINYTTDGDLEFGDDALDFPFFSMVAPFRRHRFGFQFNSYKSGNVENYVVISDSLSEHNLIDSYIYKLDFYYGYRFNGGLSIGVGPNVYIGHTEQEYIQEGGFGVFNARYKKTVTFTDMGFTAGILKQAPTWSLGGRYEYGKELETEKEFASIHSVEDLDSEAYKLPHRVGVGFAKKWQGKYKLASDFNYEVWDDFNGVDYHNSWKAGVGVAYEPKMRKRGFWKYVPYRAGLSLRELPFDYNNNKIYEQAYTVGFSLPFKSKINKLDFALEYMIRGDEVDHGIRDESIMLMIGFSGFDIFRKVHRRVAPHEIPVKDSDN
ncbi:MAG: hypothetical protein B6226_05280 [Candidatus Cloacimonetes bacterium 4572_65]|nr:MAG: hypothetical protein B6226_05280 [Candidatus Cloacimonetes bacterium 4572_65]